VGLSISGKVKKDIGVYYNLDIKDSPKLLMLKPWLQPVVLLGGGEIFRT
jgi:hypothetical protein